LLSADVFAQDPVQIQFQTDPVLVQTNSEIVFTVLTVSQVFSMTWTYQGGVTLGLWAGGTGVPNQVPQFDGRLTITATELRISGAQLQDAGNYTVEVTPISTTGLSVNSRSIQLRVFDTVAGVSLFVPSVAVEGRNVSLSCTWTAGTETAVQWGKDGSTISADFRITISAGSLVINPARRADTGEYTCTVSNLVSAGTATRSLTIFYGPDTPVLTRSTAKECVGGGNVVVGKAVRLTCISDSLPPALFSWQHNGQSIASSQTDSGVLNIQTFSTNDSGQYSCTARNSITLETSEQATDLVVVDVCLSEGEVAGIVVGCFLLLIIIIVLIVCLVRRRKTQQRQMDAMNLQRTNSNHRFIPPDPPPHGARDLGQGPNPPLHHSNTHAQRPDLLYTVLPENHSSIQTQLPNGRHNSNTHQHNSHTHTNRLQHNAIQNNSYPHNGIDNPAFIHAASQNANTQPQNPNILIQAGNAQGNAQPPTVHVTLNTLPHTAQQTNNAQMPTIHVNLNSNPTSGQEAQQDTSALTTNHSASQNQRNQTHTGQSHMNPSNQRGQSDPNSPQLNGHIDTSNQTQPRLIPTGYTHYNRNNTAQRNANTQTYQQHPEPNTRSVHTLRTDRNSVTQEASVSDSSYRQQMPWDRLRGTPAYPNNTLQREQTLPNFTSDTTDYTTHLPIRQARMPNRSQPGPQGQTATRNRAPPTQNERSVDRQTQTHSVTPASRIQGEATHSVVQLEAALHTPRSHRAQRESAQPNIRGLSGSQAAPRQVAEHSNSPQPLPLMRQQDPTGHTTVSQGPVTQQGLTEPQGTDIRALADPNHLPQAHTAQQHRAAHVQTIPQGLGTQTQPGIPHAHQPRQGGTALTPNASGQLNLRKLTQASLKEHTHRAQTFQNRNQQTQAALLHPGPQAQAADHPPPPPPPPVIPFAQFQTLPKERIQHLSPTRGHQPPRPPANVPLAQRHAQVQQRQRVQHHLITMHNHHHHPPGNAHMHVNAQRHAHANGHGHPTHFTHPRQQQAHRGRPR
ncbi:hypothetical protein LDENG_00074640, partial [Lucifuga dentata]